MTEQEYFESLNALSQDNVRLVELVRELREQNAQKAQILSKFNTVGRITTEFIPRRLLAVSNMTFKDCTYRMALCIADDCEEPMVVLDNRTYVLSWDDIVELASLAGLFDDEVTV